MVQLWKSQGSSLRYPSVAGTVCGSVLDDKRYGLWGMRELWVMASISLQTNLVGPKKYGLQQSMGYQRFWVKRALDLPPAYVSLSWKNEEAAKFDAHGNHVCPVASVVPSVVHQYLHRLRELTKNRPIQGLNFVNAAHLGLSGATGLFLLVEFYGKSSLYAGPEQAILCVGLVLSLILETVKVGADDVEFEVMAVIAY
ncbi:hypothetical protein R3P38DRAFT_2805273 [Favolaschia claudopus]|uniref:Uncharacterized protein n=1 Tax=Favolaschia claudopus TaxID=2862362 RepID=A0AAV9ZP04_9AGAR